MLKSEKGASLVEFLISTAIGGIVLAGAYDLYLASANGLLVQTDTVRMQSETKAAMDFMVRELRLMYGAPTISADNQTISFMSLEDSGFSSGGNSLSDLWDTSRSWPVNKYAPTSAGPYSVMILVGKGTGEVHPIAGNTATTLTLSDTWGTIPDNTSLFIIYRTKEFTRTADDMLRYRIEAGSYHPLAENIITDLMFTQPDPNSVDITVTARTQHVDPRTGAYHYYTLNETVRKRN
jgi:hypothetical protein